MCFTIIIIIIVIIIIIIIIITIITIIRKKTILNDFLFLFGRRLPRRSYFWPKWLVYNSRSQLSLHRVTACSRTTKSAYYKMQRYNYT